MIYLYLIGAYVLSVIVTILAVRWMYAKDTYEFEITWCFDFKSFIFFISLHCYFVF